MATPEQTQELKAILEILNREGKYAKHADVASFFKELSAHVKKLEGLLSNRVDARSSEIDRSLSYKQDSHRKEIGRAVQDFSEKLETSLLSNKKQSRKDFEEFSDDISNRFSHLAELVQSLPRIDDMQGIAEGLKTQFPEIDSPELIRDKLESLEDEDRLDATAIKNLPEATQKVVERFYGHTALYSLADVDVVGIQTGQGILWDGIKWVPFTPSGGSAANIVTEIVTATQVGSDVEIDISQLAHYATFTSLVLVMRNQIPQTYGITYTFSTPIITIPGADAGEAYQITYTYS